MESTQQQHKQVTDEEKQKITEEFLAQREEHQKQFIKQKLKDQGKDSAHNSDAEDAEAREHREDQEDAEAEKAPITYTPLGGEECPTTAEDTELEYSMTYRIAKIENLEHCTKLERLGLRKNLIKKIEGLDTCTSLVELELYDNRIRHIENVATLTQLVHLDLSFNRIKEI